MRQWEFIGRGQRIYKARKPKDDWERFRPVIIAQRARGTVKDLVEFMKTNYDFIANVSQYEYRLKLWKTDKGDGTDPSIASDYEADQSPDDSRHGSQVEPIQPMDHFHPQYLTSLPPPPPTDSTQPMGHVEQPYVPLLPPAPPTSPGDAETGPEHDTFRSFVTSQRTIDDPRGSISYSASSSGAYTPGDDSSVAQSSVEHSKRSFSSSFEGNTSSTKRRRYGLVAPDITPDFSLPSSSSYSSPVGQKDEALALASKEVLITHTDLSPTTGHVDLIGNQPEPGVRHEQRQASESALEKIMFHYEITSTSSPFSHVTPCPPDAQMPITDVGDTFNSTWTEVDRIRVAAEICFAKADFRNAFKLHQDVFKELNQRTCEVSPTYVANEIALRRQVVACLRAAVDSHDFDCAREMLENCPIVHPRDFTTLRDRGNRALLLMLQSTPHHRDSQPFDKYLKSQLFTARALMPHFDDLLSVEIHETMHTDLVMLYYILGVHVNRAERRPGSSMNIQRSDDTNQSIQSGVDQIQTTFVNFCLRSDQIKPLRSTISWCHTRLAACGSDYFDAMAIDGTVLSDNQVQAASIDLACFFWHQWVLGGVESIPAADLMVNISGPEFLHIVATCAMNRASSKSWEAATMTPWQLAMLGIENLLKLQDRTLIEDIVTEFLRAEKVRADLKTSTAFNERSQESTASDLQDVLDMFPVRNEGDQSDQHPATQLPQVEASINSAKVPETNPTDQPIRFSAFVEDDQEQTTPVQISDQNIHDSHTEPLQKARRDTLTIPGHCRTPSAGSSISTYSSSFFNASPERKTMKDTQNFIQGDGKLSPRNSAPSSAIRSDVDRLSSSMNLLNVDDGASRRSSKRESEQRMLEINGKIDEEAAKQLHGEIDTGDYQPKSTT